MKHRSCNRLVFWALVALVMAMLGAACSEKGEDSPEKELTQRQRDSVLAETGLPGAELVGTALEAADSTEARAKRLDELAK
jgi:hypothetical protein